SRARPPRSSDRCAAPATAGPAPARPSRISRARRFGVSGGVGSESISTGRGPMSDKATLLRDADEAFGELRQAIDGLGDEEMPPVCLGAGGGRELLIHIPGWHDEMIPAPGRVARGEVPYPAGTYDDFDAWNARFVERRAGVKPADVVAELEASHRRFVDAAR